MNSGERKRESIEELTRRYNRLNTRKIEAETNLRSARRQLEELKKEALEKYGTDDLDSLKEKLSEMEAENERKRAGYQELLDRVESDLQAVEDKYRETDKGETGAKGSPQESPEKSPGDSK